MEEIFDYTEKQEESNFDLKAELFKYLIYWKWLLLGMIVGGALAYLYNRYTIPKYLSEASMMITKSEDNASSSILPSSGSSASIIKLADNSLENQIVTLRSKSLIKEVVDELNHNISYYIEGKVITTEAYKTSPVIINFISPDSVVNKVSKTFLVTPINKNRFKLKEESTLYEREHEFGEIINFNGLEFTILPRPNNEDQLKSSNTTIISIRPVEDVAGSYLSRLEIGPKGKAQDILALSLVDTESRRAEDFLDQLMIQFNKNGVKDKQQVALKTTQFIQDRLQILNSELDSVETDIADFKRSNQFMDVGSGASEFISKKSSAEEQILNLETQLNVIQSVKKLLAKSDPFELLPANLGISEGNIESLIASYNQLLLQRKALLQNSTKKNPVIEDLDEQLKSLRANLMETVNSTINSLQLRLDEYQNREQKAQTRFSMFPGMEKGMRGIERQQQIKEQLYLFLLQRREEAAIAFAVTSDVAKIVDPAFTHGAPVTPQPLLILIGGILVGLIIPIIVIFVKNLLDTKVHHKGDLQSLLKSVPFIGEVPRIGTEQNDIIQINDRSPLAESFRILRTNLAYLIQKKEKDIADIIFVTSTVKGEGKTFISYNLSRTLSSTGKKVLLIGADIRNPKLHRYTHLTKGAREKGFSDYLYDYGVKPEEIISKTNDEGIAVDVILTGPIPPNPAELLMNERMEELIGEVKPLYDYIIVDTAPTMIVTDTLLISQLADYTLYVTRADFTEKNLLEFPKDLKKQGKLKGVAVILNDIDYSKFSYGAQYGYSYGYGYGYGVDKESRWERLKKKLFG
ncbi:tyrosine protein kinase [Christiangramia fulva]|uniref:non-specific protein-tyrosine kinase n=1 Tax=Christiangramia fulva TaxID=2126553 RepID=A0A2R3Z9F8_9FLAO|nr:tyrosine-protein kinase [Christiangramia fulva]AVR46880.1 tyrosine protein kinase [Christiangramia fulva]